MNCYNGEKYLREAVDSVLAQTYQNWEIIFWDNQSTDQSAAVFKSYSDPRLKYYFAQKHTWLYEARNDAFEKSRGEFIAFLDVDDWWLPNKLEKQVSLFSDPEVGIGCGNFWVQNERKKKRWKYFKKSAPTGKVLNELLKSYFVGLLTLVVRRSSLEGLHPPFNPRYHVIGDYDLVVRISARWKLACVQEPVALYRLHGSNETTKHHVRQIDELEHWLQEMNQIDIIRSCPNFRFVKNNITYLKAIGEILQANKMKAYDLSCDLPLGQQKLKLWLAMLLPTAVAQGLKN